MLKFLVDESSGKKFALALVEKGFDVKFITEIMPGVKDSEVLTFAEREKRILITNDKNFGELIFRWGKPSSGVILLRLRFDVPKRRISTLLKLIEKLGNKLFGCFIVADEYGCRIRKI